MAQKDKTVGDLAKDAKEGVKDVAGEVKGKVEDAVKS